MPKQRGQKKAKNWPPVGIRFEPSEYGKIQAAAKASDRTISDMVRRLVHLGWKSLRK